VAIRYLSTTFWGSVSTSCGGVGSPLFSIVQSLFFMTPIIWNDDTLRQQGAWQGLGGRGPGYAEVASMAVVLARSTTMAAISRIRFAAQ
jgi:hypothetical protein